MRTRFGSRGMVVILGCLALLPAAPALAAARPDKASELIEKAIQAHGGRAALADVEDSGIRTGILRMYKPSDNQARFVMFSRGEKTRVDLDMAGIAVTVVFAPGGGWMRTQGQVTDLAERQRQEQARFEEHALGKLARYDDPGYKTSYLGPSVHDGRTLEGVSITGANGVTTEFYLDPKTWLVAVIAFEDVNLDTKEWSRQEAVFSDYRVLDGVPAPYRLEARVDGTPTQAMEFALVDLRAPVPDDIFRRPGNAAADNGSALPAPVTFGCDYADGQLYVDVSVNGNAPVPFLLDTGAGLSILDAGYAAELGVVKTGELKAAAAGGSLPAGVATVAKLGVAGVECKDVQVLLADLTRVAGAKGILGYNFLNRFATTIDYAARAVTLSDPARTEDPIEGAHVIPMEVRANSPHVRARLNGAVDIEMAVDTGAALTILPTHALGELKLEQTTGITATGADGQEIAMSQGHLATLAIGDLVIKDAEVAVPAQQDKGEPTGSTVQSSGDGTLGNTLLSRYRVTFNYDQQKITLEPTDSTEWVRTGVSLEAVDGEVRVRAVTPGLSAKEQGVKVGDVILEIDGKPIRLLGEAARLLQGPRGSQVKLRVRRAGTTLDFLLERRSIQ